MSNFCQIYFDRGHEFAKLLCFLFRRRFFAMLSVLLSIVLNIADHSYLFWTRILIRFFSDSYPDPTFNKLLFGSYPKYCFFFNVMVKIIKLPTHFLLIFVKFMLQF
jgi:hypothetical protein